MALSLSLKIFFTILKRWSESNLHLSLDPQLLLPLIFLPKKTRNLQKQGPIMLLFQKKILSANVQFYNKQFRICKKSTDIRNVSYSKLRDNAKSKKLVMKSSLPGMTPLFTSC